MTDGKYTPPENWQRMSEAAIKEHWLRWVFSDYAHFCGTLQIIPRSGVREPFRWNPIQKDYVAKRTPRDVILKHRRAGMSTECVARSLWHMLTHPGASVMMICQSMSDHQPFRGFTRLINTFWESLFDVGVPLKFKKYAQGGVWELADRDAVFTLIEAGASQAAASKKGRGAAVTRLHGTETSFWEHAPDTLNALMECVPAPEYGSEVVIESTPNGIGDYYHSLYENAKRGTNGYTAHFWPWFKDPECQMRLAPGEVVTPCSPQEEHLVSLGVTPEQLKFYRAKTSSKGSDLTLQEYASDDSTCFLVSGRTFFDKTLLIRALAACREPIKTLRVGPANALLLRIWHNPQPGMSYVVAADTSEGIAESWDPAEEAAGRGQPSKHDASAAVVLERGTGRHMATLWGLVRPGDLAKPLADLGMHYRDTNGRPATIAVERNNHGAATLRALTHEEKYPAVYRDPKDNREGWLTNAVTRANGLSVFEKAVRKGEWQTHDKMIVGQLLKFVVDEDGKPCAAKGSHDDLCMCAMIGYDILSKPMRERNEVGAGW
jgi:hypothetical protein